MLIFIFFLKKIFCPVEKNRVTPHCLDCDSLTLSFYFWEKDTFVKTIYFGIITLIYWLWFFKNQRPFITESHQTRWLHLILAWRDNIEFAGRGDLIVVWCFSKYGELLLQKRQKRLWRIRDLFFLNSRFCLSDLWLKFLYICCSICTRDRPKNSIFDIKWL